MLAQRSVEERKARSGVLLMLLTAFGVFVALCEAGSTSWGSPLGPRQSQRRIIHPGTKCVITMRKPGSSSPAAEDCQACWRGGLLLISCGEALNAGAHSPPYTHIQGGHNGTYARSGTHAHRHVRAPPNATCCSCTAELRRVPKSLTLCISATAERLWRDSRAHWFLHNECELNELV